MEGRLWKVERMEARAQGGIRGDRAGRRSLDLSARIGGAIEAAGFGQESWRNDVNRRCQRDFSWIPWIYGSVSADFVDPSEDFIEYLSLADLDFIYFFFSTAIGGEYLSNSKAGALSTFFDVGGVFGGILAGHISDHLDARAITAASFMYCAIPTLFLYRAYGSISLFWNVAFMIIAGLFVNGPYALITTAVSADLGTHASLKGNSRALATVTAIIDGTGSAGAAIGPLLTGYLSTQSWSTVFAMLTAAALMAGLLLTKLVATEVKLKLRARRSSRSEESLI
ncbi:putative glycerol-3-phosphate transporter 1 [Dendrobium catenatum]|nr:putative glycerol-3-phosphate transporter 1 [Dendrobium catenatum]